MLASPRKLTATCNLLALCDRDVKLDNLLLVSPGDISHIKIADFGFAKKLHSGRGSAMQTVCGTSGVQGSLLAATGVRALAAARMRVLVCTLPWRPWDIGMP